MDFGSLIPIMGILLAMIPVAGLTIILTVRFAMKPFLESLTKALKDAGFSSGGEQQAQIDDLEEQVMLLGTEIRRLQAGQAFDQELIQGRTDPHAPR